VSSLIRLGSYALAAGVLALAAGCGGGGGKPQPSVRTIRGSGFRFQAPFTWQLRRTDTQVSVSPTPTAPELVSVSTFPLLHAYKPSLFAAASKELDSTAKQLATRLHGSIESSRSVVVAGIRSRRYQLRYTADGEDYREAITFVLEGKKEFQLLCRWDASKSEPDACSRLEQSFAAA
jgi:hypothetical protein